MFTMVRILCIITLIMFAGLLIGGTIALSRGKEDGEGLLWASIAPLVVCILCYVWMM